MTFMAGHQALLMCRAVVSDPSFSSVVSLIGFDDSPGTTIPTDAIAGTTITNPSVAVTVQLTSARFGAGGLYSPAPSTGVRVNRSFTGASTDYTLEFSVFVESTGGNGRFFGVGAVSGGHYYALSRNAGGFLTFVNSIASAFPTSGTLNLSTWYHIAITYASSGGIGKIYLDGIEVYSPGSAVAGLGGTGSYNIDLGQTQSIGGSDATTRIDEFRWTQGVVRYAGAFSSPSSAFPRS